MHADPTRAAKPRTRDPERRKQDLLTAATEIVVEQGSAALTHRAAAARAGVALGSATRYFPSIDDLREEALRQLAADLDEDLDEIETELASCDDPVDLCTALVHEFLLDDRQVHATMAMINAASTDRRLRSIALRWNDRLIRILTEYVGPDRALTAQLYLDGATMHAALNDAPLSREVVRHTLRTIFTMPTTPGDQP